jgi:cytoskeletal protein RodZ
MGEEAHPRGGAEAPPHLAAGHGPPPHLGVRYDPSRRPVVCPPNGRPDREEPVAKRLLELLQAVLVFGALVALITAIAVGVQWLERSFEGSSRPETQIGRTHPSTRVEGTRPKMTAEGPRSKTTIEELTSSRPETRIERTHPSTIAEGTRHTTTIGEATSSIVEPLPESPPEAPPTATATPTATSKPTSSATTSATQTSSGVSASPRAGAGALPGSGGAPVLSVVAGILLVGAGIVGAMRSRRTS